MDKTTGDIWVGSISEGQEKYFEQIAGYFGDEGKIVLHNCYAATGEYGPKALNKISQLTGVTVEGADGEVIPGLFYYPNPYNADYGENTSSEELYNEGI